MSSCLTLSCRGPSVWSRLFVLCGVLGAQAAANEVSPEGKDAPGVARVRKLEIADRVLSHTTTKSIRGHLGDVGLRNVVSVSVNEASTLATVRGALTLGVEDLPGDIARALAAHRGELELPRLKSLSDEAAKALGNHHGDLILSAVTDISDHGIVSLARLPRGGVALGVRELTVPSARALSRIHGAIELENLESLDEPVAAALSTNTEEMRLMLASLSSGAAGALARTHAKIDLWYARYGGGGRPPLRFDAVAAERLARYAGDLYLPISVPAGDRPKIIDSLAHHRGPTLSLILDGPLTLEEARSLGRHTGRLTLEIRLESDVVPFDGAAAMELARHQGPLVICCRGTLSEEAASALAMHSHGSLTVKWLAKLTTNVAAALGQHKGPISVGCSVDGTASDAAVLALARHNGALTVPGDFVRAGTVDGLLAHSDSLAVEFYYGRPEPSDEILGRLAEYQGALTLVGNLKTTVELAKRLAAHVGPLSLGAVPQEEDAVDALLRHEGPLYFPDFSQIRTEAAARLFASDTTLSTECLMWNFLFPGAEKVAAILATKRGRLSLPRLQYISPDALRVLTAKKTVVLPPLDSVYIIDSEGNDVSARDVVSHEFYEYNSRPGKR